MVGKHYRRRELGKEKKKKRLKPNPYVQSHHWAHEGQTQQAAAAIIHVVAAVSHFPAQLET